ncbi:MAG: translation initiation factor eIF-2B subunit [Candidatus Dojkabacteria bacterium]|jgi:ribose 1,5-bisphosphate isomerase|nr:translation initiation factor eIF-2B subunit [Candidatus Dojkabacteria bacterium]
MKIEKILNIEKEIKDLNIQGATNIAIATLEGMKTYLQESKVTEKELFYNEFIQVGNMLADARLNEPLARNGVKYIKYMVKKNNSDLHTLESMKQSLDEYCDSYLYMISDSKRAIIDSCVPYVKNLENVLTHCHSSTAVSLIKGIAEGKESFDAVCTETRPLMQGHKTAKSLLEGGISTTLIADSAAESFVIGRGSISIDGVLMGCDQITMKGYCINKIGSWGIAMSSFYASKPLYVVSPLLKVDPNIGVDNIVIEVRESKELWSDAPKGLNMFNPAFEIIDSNLITGFLTEFGILKPSEIADVIKAKYSWLFES